MKLNRNIKYFFYLETIFKNAYNILITVAPHSVFKIEPVETQLRF